MSDLDLSLKKVNLIYNNEFLISGLVISFTKLANHPALESINIKVFDLTDGIFKSFEDELGNKHYSLSGTTDSSCQIDINPTKYLKASDTIYLSITGKVYGQSDTSSDYIIISFNNTFADGNLNKDINYRLPDISGNYRIQLTELNEFDVSPHNIMSNVISVINPIKDSTFNTDDSIENRSSPSLTNRLVDVTSTDTSPITAEFHTVFKIVIE